MIIEIIKNIKTKNDHDLYLLIVDINSMKPQLLPTHNVARRLL